MNPMRMNRVNFRHNSNPYVKSKFNRFSNLLRQNKSRISKHNVRRSNMNDFRTPSGFDQYERRNCNKFRSFSGNPLASCHKYSNIQSRKIYTNSREPNHENIRRFKFIFNPKRNLRERVRICLHENEPIRKISSFMDRFDDISNKAIIIDCLSCNNSYEMKISRKSYDAIHGNMTIST